MPTVIHHDRPVVADTGSSAGAVVAIVVIVVLGILFFLYALPAIRSNSNDGSNITVPDQNNVVQPNDQGDGGY